MYIYIYMYTYIRIYIMHIHIICIYLYICIVPTSGNGARVASHGARVAGTFISPNRKSETQRQILLKHVD